VRVEWEYPSGCGWRPVRHERRFRDETCGFTRAGRVVVPGSVLAEAAPAAPDLAPQGRVVGVVASRHFYLRARLAAGRPDAPPRVRAVFADALLVEQSDEAATPLDIIPPYGEPLRFENLTPAEGVRDDVNDAAADLARRGWGVGVKDPGRWQVSARPPRRRDLTPDRRSVRLVVLGVGTGAARQAFTLPCPNPALDPLADPDAGPAPRVRPETLRVTTLEPHWAWLPGAVTGVPWKPVRWRPLPDLNLAARGTAAYVLDPETRTVTFGDGESGRVPPPGALVVARYAWTYADAGDLAAGYAWERVEPDARRRAPRAAPELRLRNPLAAAGGDVDESLPEALSRLAAEYSPGDPGPAEPEARPGDRAPGRPLPPMAVTLADFARLAVGVPGTTVARARAWAEILPDRPGVSVPGTVTVVILPALPDRRPEPTAGLLDRVARFLGRRRVVTDLVRVVGPQYVPVRVRATVHVAPGAAVAVRSRAARALAAFLHPLRGGTGGAGWPFGRGLRVGEVLGVLGGVDGVTHVTGVALAPDGGGWQTEPIPVPPLALPDLAGWQLDAREDA
jgi:hypothetical protein